MWNVKPGDLVVCVKTGFWRNAEEGIAINQIPYGSIATVMEVFSEDGDTFLVFEEWGDCWLIDHFRPIAKPSIESLRSLIINPDLVKEDA